MNKATGISLVCVVVSALLLRAAAKIGLDRTDALGNAEPVGANLLALVGGLLVAVIGVYFAATNVRSTGLRTRPALIALFASAALTAFTLFAICVLAIKSWYF